MYGPSVDVGAINGWDLSEFPFLSVGETERIVRHMRLRGSSRLLGIFVVFFFNT